jgi:outer membrane immunogenic protein
MKRQRSRAFLALAFGLISAHAWADGWEGKRPIPPCVSPFAGAYLGLAAGYAEQRAEVTNLQPGAPAFGQTFSDNEGGFTFGGYAGYNWQHCNSRLVFGIEADFNYLNSSPTAFDIETFAGGLTETTSLESSIDWFGTLRGRLGFMIHNHMLVYATGGLAYGRADHTLSDDCPACSATPPITGFPVSQSNDVTNAGWTVGGGAELLHDSKWFLRAEALYVDLGSETHNYRFVIPSAGTVTSAAKWDDQFWVARLGISYKFGNQK